MRLSRPPPLRNLRAFCVAARHRSFKFAAEELFLTPSAVSHQMKELEDALGVRLFVRKTRALELTTAGHMLLDEVEPLLEALDRSLAQIARQNSRRALRVLLPPFFANELFVPRMASFCAAHPELDFQIDTHDPRPSTHPPSADVSVLLGEAPPPGLKAWRLFSIALVAVCARAHTAMVARLGREVFRELTLIVHKARPSAWADWAKEVGLDPPEPRSVIELDTMSAVVRAAERGLGIALAPEALCASSSEAGALVRIYSVALMTGESYFLVCRPRDMEKPEIAALIEWMLAQFGVPDES